MPKTRYCSQFAVANYCDLPIVVPTYLPANCRLYTSQPDPGGSPTINEASYAGYAPQPLGAGVAGGWSLTGPQTASYLNPVTFPECTAGSETITHYGLTMNDEAAGEQLMYWAPLEEPFLVGVGVSPIMQAGSIQITEL